MINKSEHPVAWSTFLYELDDAREHLEQLIQDLGTKESYSEGELRVDLGHVFAHLNRAWNARNISSDITTEQWSTLSHFPTDMNPVG